MVRLVGLLLSVILHGLIFYGLWDLDAKPVPPEEIEVEWIETPVAPEPVKAGGTGSSKGGRHKGGFSLRALSPRGEGLLKPKGQEYYDRLYAEAKGSSEWPEEAWGSHGVDLAQYAEHAGHFDQLREEIESLLFYPGALARRQIHGVINARLYFKDGSTCAFKRTRVEGAQPYLRVYVLALIDKLCKLTVVTRMGFREGQFADLSFNFYISENIVTRQMDELASGGTANVLTFQRGYYHSSLEWELGPIRGTWFAPMVFVNFPWIMENWEKHVDKKDPLRDFRR